MAMKINLTKGSHLKRTAVGLKENSTSVTLTTKLNYYFYSKKVLQNFITVKTVRQKRLSTQNGCERRESEK